MDINYRDVPKTVWDLIADTQCSLGKQKNRKVGQSEAITHLLKSAYTLTDDEENVKNTLTATTWAVDSKQ